jgi:hypothetical protein
LAIEYNARYTSGKSGRQSTDPHQAPLSAAAVMVNASANQDPVSAGAVAAPIKQGTSAYMLWRSDYYKTHGKLPAKGVWQDVPNEVVETYKQKIANNRVQKA